MINDADRLDPEARAALVALSDGGRAARAETGPPHRTIVLGAPDAHGVRDLLPPSYPRLGFAEPVPAHGGAL